MPGSTSGSDDPIIRYLRSIDARLVRIEQRALNHDQEFVTIRALLAALRVDIARLSRYLSAGGPWR